MWWQLFSFGLDGDLEWHFHVGTALSLGLEVEHSDEHVALTVHLVCFALVVLFPRASYWNQPEDPFVRDIGPGD